MGLLLFICSALGLLCAGACSLWAFVRGKRATSATIGAVMVAWVISYTVVLVAVSLMSREILLDRGQAKRLCGIYIDCHIGVSVEIARRVGPRYAVKIRVSSDARRAGLHSGDLTAILVDSGGSRYKKAIPSRALAPGESFIHDVEYILPGTVRPRYLLVEGFAGAERIVIGDEDSFLHKKVKFRLDSEL